MSAKHSKPQMLRASARTRNREVQQLVERLYLESFNGLWNEEMTPEQAKEHFLGGIARFIARKLAQRTVWRILPLLPKFTDLGGTTA